MANKQLNAVITIGGTITGSLKSALGTTQTKLRAIGDTVRDLKREQRDLGREIRDSLQNGRPVGDLHERYSHLTRKIADARREQERMNRAVRSMEAGRVKMGAAIGGLATIGAVAATAGAPVVAAASFEKAMLGVAKQVDGARDKSGKLTQVYHDMAREIQILGREVPIATNELAGMVEAGARMGIARKDLIGFTRDTAKMATAMDLPREQLADDMGKIANLYKIPVPAIGELGDAINYLADLADSAWHVFRVSRRDIIGPSRLKNIFRARAAVCLVASRSGYSYNAIGRALGERDKTTIGSAIARARAIAAHEPSFKDECERLMEFASTGNLVAQ